MLVRHILEFIECPKCGARLHTLTPNIRECVNCEWFGFVKLFVGDPAEPELYPDAEDTVRFPEAAQA